MKQSKIIDALETYQAAGARRLEVEEALRPLDGHRRVTAARIVYVD